MNRTDAPKKQPVPFGVNGSREDLLPTTPAGDNQASYDAGFPPVTMILKAAGGLPPKGQDMNQILYELSSIGRWLSAGALNSFDAAFSTSIGGYPKGAVLVSDDGATPFISTIEANTNNPNSSTTGWVSLAKVINFALLSGGANQLPYFTAANTLAQTAFTAAGRGLVGQASVAAMLTYLGIPMLGTAAQKDVGTGAAQIPDMSSFASLLAANGYMKLPGGLIFQWGTATVTTASAAGGTGVATLPTTYPNEHLAAFCIFKSSVLIANAYVPYADPTSTSTITLVLDAAANAASPVGPQPVMFFSLGR